MQEIKELKVCLTDFRSEKTGKEFKKISIMYKDKELEMLFANDKWLTILELLGYDVTNLVQE